MEQYIKRKLTPDEIVHHIDGNKRNNIIDNLELTTRSNHAKHHYKPIINSDKKYLRGSEVGNSKLNEEKVKQIKIKLSNNEKITYIARLFNVDEATIRLIKNNKSWKHVN